MPVVHRSRNFQLILRPLEHIHKR
uniref:Uncharacterized protein n=1 Tax=Rhizophora mucronata TaxID=61149 RepID=A0A2P2Q1J2_RHIMU